MAEFYGTIKNGSFKFSNLSAYKEWLKTRVENEDILVKFDSLVDSKTLRQLKLAYHCFREISKNTGYTVNEVKILVKMQQGLCNYHTIEGKEICFCDSLSDFTKKELSEFIVKMNEWAGIELNMKLLNFDDIKFLCDV